jgi:exonuclease SbcC
VIEFEGLNEAGVLLLSGPTGSGKTTILDAVCFAIFGEIPRSNKGSDTVSDHRDRETDPAPGVVLEFTVAGARMKVTRRPAYLRPKKHKAGELTEEKQFVRLERLDGEEWSEEATGWSEANSRLRGLVGMNADQFHQLVLLPQGRFARFLEASAKDRKELLETLFPGNDLTYVEEWLKQRARKDTEAREVKLREIADRLEQVRPVFESLGEEAEQEFPDHHEPGPVAAWTAGVLAILEQRASDAAEARERSQTTCSAAEKALAEATKRRDLVRQRGEAEDQVEALEAKADWRKELAAQSEAADRAAAVVPLIRQAREQGVTADRCAERSAQLAAELRADPLAETDELPALGQIRAEAAADVAAITIFEREGLERRRELDRLLQTRRSELEQIRKGGPETALTRAETALAGAADARELARRELIDVRTRRTAGMAAEIATTLEPGKPCPVCGATEHPGADHGDRPPVSEAEEAAAAKRDAESEATLAAAAQARDAAEAENRRLLARLEGEIETGESERKALLAREAELAAGEASPTARRERLEKLVGRIEDFTTAVHKAADAGEAAAKTAKSAADQAIASGFEGIEQAEQSWIEPEVLAAGKAELAAHDEALNLARGLLGGELREVDRAEVVDLEPLESALAEAVTARDRDVGVHATIDGNRQTFETVTAQIPALFEQLAPLREAAARSQNLDRLASGDNDRRMRLSTFVLAVRLRQVIQAANRHLRLMSSGRYELVYSGDVAAHGAASGLGIRVFDSHTSGTRSTGTFSGGESFYASLSLALGLAEVVQQESGGKPLETLFIDEGFGTLDARTLDQVMDVIDDLREGGRTVGLVSHVDELRNRVTARIEVHPTKSGSTIEVVGV